MCFSCFCTWRICCVPNPLLTNMSTTSCFSDRRASPRCPFLCFVCMLLCESENVVNHFCRVQSSGLEMLSLHEVLHPSSFLTFPWPRKLSVLTFSQTCLMVIPCWQCSSNTCTFCSIELGSQKVHRCVHAFSNPRCAGASGLRFYILRLCMLCFIISPCI